MSEAVLDTYENVGSFVGEGECCLWKCSAENGINILLKGRKSWQQKYKLKILFILWLWNYIHFTAKKKATSRWNKITLEKNTEKASFFKFCC